MAPKVKTAKNSKLPKLPENYFEPVGKGGWPPYPYGSLVYSYSIAREETPTSLTIIQVCFKRFLGTEFRSASKYSS
jgi:hypothetical protein